MKARLLVSAAGTLLALTLALTGGALAAKTGKQVKFGPFASGSPDSGTCGNDWATDTFNRVYSVTPTPNPDGTFTVREDFKDGSFVTVAGPSPGGCDTNQGGTVAAGITGEFEGFFIITVSGGTFNPNATCPAGCRTSAFVTAFFGPTATFDIPSFAFDYEAEDEEDALCLDHWRNASADRGGNEGDIASTCPSLPHGS